MATTKRVSPNQAAQHVNERLVYLAQILPGHRVLDVATGLGEPAFTAARRAGSSGSVIATDLSPAMLALAREEADRLGLQNIEFREMDAEEPDCQRGLSMLPCVAGH